MKLFKRRRLRVDILTIFITLFLISILGIIYYSQTRSSEAILKVGNDLIDRTSESIEQTLDGFLRPMPFIKISSFLLNDELLGTSDMQSLIAFMHILLDSYPQLTNAYLADTKGDMYIENQIRNQPQIFPFLQNNQIPPGTRYVSEIITRNPNSTDLIVNFKKFDGQVIKVDRINNINFDPRTRPWYSGAQTAKDDDPWIGVYQFYGVNKKGITIAFPVFAKGVFAGVAAADLSTELIAEQLKKFSLSNKGVVFIVNSSGQIIAYDKDTPFSSAAHVHNPLISTAYKIHQKNKQKNFKFTLNKVKYIANFRPYGFSKAEIWEIATVIPEDVFIGKIKEANRETFFFSLLMLVLGMILVVISSHKISRPIMELAQETKDIIKFKFDKKTQIATPIYEVQVLIDALNTAKATLASFAKYVPKTLVKQLLQNQMIATVGGKKQPVTVLFTDVANFTELAEQIDPEFLMIHFSEYLNAMTKRIQEYQGNIDKYIGDAIMAFWGAPLDDKEHIQHACKATLACKQEVNQLNEKWSKLGKPILPTRFGLNTGIAIIGNMGSNDRLNYTAIGDTVNLAARLEALNKFYGTQIIASQSIYAECAEKFLFRPLDIVQVRGKKQSTILYELVNELAIATSQEIEICELTWRAYRAYQGNEIKKARQLYKEILQKFPKDEVAKLYISRCEEDYDK